MSMLPVAHRLPRWRCCILAAALCLQLSGCAINPYVASQRPLRQAPERSDAPGMHDALRYADGLYDAYSAKFSEEFQRQQALSGGLLTLGAVVLGLGAAKAHRDAFVGASLVGGLGYELGTWNTNPGRAGIYLDGMKAVGCAKLAIAPLNVGPDQMMRLDTRATQARDALVKTARAAGSTTRWLSLTGPAAQNPSPLQNAAAAELAELDGVIATANATLMRAASFSSRVRQAGPMLEGKLDEIARLVTGALNGTQANLSELPKAVAALKDYAQVFVPGLDLGPALKNSVAAANTGLASSAEAADSDPGQPTDAKSREAVPVRLTPEEGLARALGALRASRLVLASAVAEVNGAIDVGTIDETRVRLASCTADVAAAAPPLALKRSSVSFTAGTAGTAVVEVTGGTKPVSIGLLDLPAPGVTVSAVPGGGVVLVSAGTDAPAGRTFSAVVSDAGGATANLSIRIEAKPAASAEAADGLPPARASTCVAPHDAASVCLMQHVLRVKMDGQWGPQSCSALLSRGARYAPGGVVDAAALGRFKADAGLAANADGAAILKALRERGQPCELPSQAAAAAAPAVAAETKVAAAEDVAACRPIANPAACRIKGALCQNECLMAEGELASLRGRLGLSGQPAEFDAALRAKLARFQADRQLKNTRGEYTVETAQALAPPR